MDHQTLSLPPISYNSPQSSTQPMAEFSQMDLGLAVLMFNQGDDPISYLNTTEDLDAYDSDCDDVSNVKAILMANLSNYGSDVISDVPHFEPYHNDMDNQNVHAIQGF
uniref:Integrase, catalytic region, zinc finger, CCHC-type, peptidase aspartic, catalytic n=1 Tax=Tanacetum cinerariifolium TaxID=118510 RepID=A0A6L2M7Q3_TANCI|nr:hypothetical protein [Tanacetum cinerariifolium]